MAKKELVPAKQEKAHERLKNFRTELADYRQSFDRLKRDREDSVRLSDAILEPSTGGTDLWLTTANAHLAAANGPKSHRAPRSSPTPCRNPRKPLFAIKYRSKLTLCPFKTSGPVLWRRSPRLYQRNTRPARAELHVFNKRCARRVS